MEGSEELTRNIEQWKVKRLIENLDRARGNGTSLISLVVPPREQIALITKMITDELGKASNIKSRVVRQAVQSAITSVKERLKLYNKIPNRGLILYCGEIINDQGVIEKKVTIDFEPFKPINTSLYLCDNKFNTEALKELLETDDKFGFIIMDGNGSLFATLQGSVREVLHKFSVDLPKKHGRGGQSALRFARLRMEKRHNYVRRVGEIAVQCFITNDRVNVSGIVLAGIADFKKELGGSDLLDPRLAAKVVKVVDVGYGGDNGFNQAIELSAETLTNVKFVREKKLITRFFEEIATDTRKYCYGIQDTIRALEMGAVESLLLYENLEEMRYVMQNNATGETKVVLLTLAEEKDHSHFQADGVDLEVVTKQALSEWLVESHHTFGANLEFITNKSSEGSQFVRGFGGLGGFLRYQLDMMDINPEITSDDEWDDFM